MIAGLSQYWLGQWIQEYEVTSSQQVMPLLSLPGPMGRLEELAEAAPTFRSTPDELPDLSVAAGRGIDLSGYMSCRAYECMRKHIDASYPNIFHYFDNIVVEGVSPRKFLRELNTLPKGRHEVLHADLINDIQIVLYLKEIGAYDFTVFREKPNAYCGKHLNHYAKALGIPSYRDGRLLQKAVDRLSEEASFETHWRKGVWSFWVQHDFFPEPAYGTFTKGKKRPPTPEQMATLAIRNYTGGSLADVVWANRLGAPLARAINTTWIESNEGQVTSGASDVALHLNLPVIDGIQIKDLLHLREDEKPFFNKFRAALRKAIEEQLQNYDSAPPQVVARAVIREYIEPALADIDVRLKVSHRKLSTKIGASLAVGTIVTSAGLIGSLPLLVDTGVVAMAASLPHIYKYFDDYGDNVQLNDMYFLWKAKKVASAGHFTAIEETCR